MRVRFLRVCPIVLKRNFCGFSGDYDTEATLVRAGEELDVSNIARGPKQRHKPRMNTIFLPGDTLHPDRFDIPETAYEVI